MVTLGLSVYTMWTSIPILTLCLATCAVAQWNTAVIPGMPNRDMSSAFASSSGFFPSSPSNDGFFNDPRSTGLSSRQTSPSGGSVDNWSWTNGQNNGGGSSFFTSGQGFQQGGFAGANSITTPYYGTLTGSLSTYQHGVSGQIYAVDDGTILVKGLVYDGQVPDAYFYIGNSDSAQLFQGTILANSQGQKVPLGRYDGQDLVLKLGPGGNLRAYKWLAIMSASQNSNFGDIMFPREFSPPKAVSLGPLMPPSGFMAQSSVRSGTVTVINDKQIQIMNLFYDGQAPDAYFWAGQGAQPNNQGTIVPFQNSYAKLPAIMGQTITLTLPGNYNIQNVNWLAIWSRSLNTNLGYVMIPGGLNVPPTLAGTAQSSPPAAALMDLPNCEAFGKGKLQVRWSMQGQDLLVQLKAQIDDGQYVAFGLSGSQNQIAMIGSDVVVAYWDADSGSVLAQDYALTSRQECSGALGVCPDSRLGGTNNIDVLSGSRADGYLTVTYKRRINTGDRLDQVVNPNLDTYVVWAVGPLNGDNYPSKHYDGMRASPEVGERLRFGRNPVDNCPTGAYSQKPGLSMDGPPKGFSDGAWAKQYIFGNETKSFLAVIGPSGGKKGFMGMTSKPTWGIVWYINGKMAPELVLRRGDTYHFFVYGGMYSQAQPRYHPFYITADSSGGFGNKSPADKSKEERGIVAGVARTSDGQYEPTAMGQHCAFTKSGSTDPDTFTSFEEFNRTLRLQCDGSPPGILPVGDGAFGLLEWTPSSNDPDMLYYQCFSHRDMGWKITLVNEYRDYGPVRQKTDSAGLISNGYTPNFFNRDPNGSSRLSALTATFLIVIFACVLSR